MNKLFPDPPRPSKAYFVSMLGRGRGLGDIRAIQIRKDGRLAFEEREERELLRPVGFKTGGRDDFWLFASGQELGLDESAVSAYVRALLEIFNFCGYQVPPGGFANLHELDDLLPVLDDDDVLAWPISPPPLGPPALPIGTTIRFHNGNGHVTFTFGTGDEGPAQVLCAVRPPFTKEIDGVVSLLWQQQVLDALAVAGVFVQTTFVRDSHGTACIVQNNSPFVPRIAAEW